MIASFSIIIPVYKNLKGLQNVVNDIRKSDISIAYEIIVCNDSADRFITDWLSDQGIKEVKIEPRKGSYFARNRGIEAASTEHFLFIDTDVIVKKGWFRLLKAHFEDHDYLAFSINMAISKEMPLLKRYSKFTEFKCKSFWETNHFGPTAFLWVSKRVFNDTGLFDEELYSGGDFELGNRCWHANFKMKFLENEFIFHPPRSLFAKYKQQIRILQGISVLQKKYSNRLLKTPEISFTELLKGPFKFVYSILRLKKLAAYKDRDWSTAQIIWAEFWHKKMYYWALLKVLTTNKPHFD